MSSTTLRDVAEFAGVSIGTASAALNNRPTVSSETRVKVIDAAISLGYPLKEAEILAQHSELSVIGLLMKQDQGEEWTIDQFYSKVQMGVTNACSANKMSVMVSFIDVDQSNRPASWPAMLDDQRIDGLLMAGVFLEEIVTKIQHRNNIPIVLLDGYCGKKDVDTIVTDNIGGARQLMDHLFDHGHEKIGLVGWNPESPPSIQDRYLGYIGSMNRKGFSQYVEPSILIRADGYKATQRLLKRYPEITAIFACNDETALGVIDAAHAMGLNVPADLSVIGFDDIQSSHEIDPPLTTIHVHKSWMGSLGVNALIERSRNPGQPKISKVISTHLVKRQTVAFVDGKQSVGNSPLNAKENR